MKIFLNIFIIFLFKRIYSVEFFSTINANENTLIEGQGTIFDLSISANSSISCAIYTNQQETTANYDDYDLKASYDGTNIRDMSSFSAYSGTITFTLSALPNGDSAEILTIVTTCDGESFSTKFTINPASGGNGDPHFAQRIFDRNFNITRPICYDVIGNRNQFIHIYSEPKKQLRIYGQLKDNYYFQKVVIQLKRQKLNFTEKRVFAFSSISFNWIEFQTKNWIKFPGYFIRMRTDMVEIKENLNDQISIGVRRGFNSFGKFYLDVLLFGLNIDYDEKDGLIGQIGNNHISIFPPIQENDSENRLIVIVNGKKTIGSKTVRNGLTCTLVDVNDLLNPYKLSDYIINQI